MRHHAQFYLGVIGRKDEPVRTLGDKGLAYLAAAFGADWDVLEIGVGGRQPSRGGERLVEGCVHAAVLLGNVVRERLYVCGQQLLGRPIIQDGLYDWVLVRVFKESLLVSAPASACALARLGVYLHLLKENFPYLLWRSHVSDGSPESLRTSASFSAISARRESAKSLRDSRSILTPTRSIEESTLIRGSSIFS